MKDFCVIGSGISGATIANHLSKKYIVDVYDKARGAGGRASNKKFNLITVKAFLIYVKALFYFNNYCKLFYRHISFRQFISRVPGTDRLNCSHFY